MICNIDDLKVVRGFNNRIRTQPSGIIGKLKFWTCKKRGTHDFEMVLDEWRNGNVAYDDWGVCSEGKLSTTPIVDLKEATRWCSRHTILRCKRCGFEWERLVSGVKGCGAHVWIAGKEWPVEWHCLPWGDPNATVRVGTSEIPPSVMQINNPKLEYLRDKIRV